MREILFRGKRVDNGDWVYGVPTKDLKGQIVIVESVFECAEYNCLGANCLYVDENSVGQFTGLTDNNGKKIFEGDIVSYEDCQSIDYYRDTIIINRGVIKFSDGAFYVTERETVEMDDLSYNGTMDCKVIGNIYNNPELLGVE